MLCGFDRVTKGLAQQVSMVIAAVFRRALRA
jgi:hypothetical protein